MAKPPYFRFFPGDDLLLDPACRRMSLEALGAHMKLYCLAWIEHGLPADSAKLSRELGISLRRFNTLWKEISPAWEESEGRVYCQSQEQKRQEYDDFVKKQQINGRKGGRPRGTQPEPKETQAFLLGSPKKSLSPSSSLSLAKQLPPLGPASAPSQAVGDPSPGGGGRSVVSDDESDETLLADDSLWIVPDWGRKGSVLREIVPEHARREALQAARDRPECERYGLKGSVEWVAGQYGLGKWKPSQSGTRGVVQRLGIQLPEHLTHETRTKILGWLETHPEEAGEIFTAASETQDARNDPRLVPGLFCARIGERMKAEAKAVGVG